MEIRCDKCTHVGPAASVGPGPEGVVLVCENCGHENILDVGESDEPDGASDGSNEVVAPAGEASSANAFGESSASAFGDKTAFGDKEQVRQWLREDALEALIPQPGSGPRCRKCAWLVDPDADNCSRCGLSRREAERYEPGEAPWERPPEGKESEQEQAELLWESFADEPDPSTLEKFVHFVRDEGLLNLGVRRLRFYLIDHPEDERAVEHLRDLAESLQSRIIVAQVQAKADASEFQDEVSRFKQRVMVGLVVFWGGIFLLFLVLFWDNCSTGMPSL
ncbi:MAG: hypothetical protein ACOC9W_03025 [Persicimonas sp.]